MMNNNSGYVLLDVLLAIFILSFGFLAFYNAIKTTTLSVVKQERRITELIEESNVYEEEGFAHYQSNLP